MHNNLTTEALLTQLGYPQTEQAIKQMETIISETKGFENFSKHIPAFADALAVEKGYIAMSNSKNCLKIKCDGDLDADNLSAFGSLVDHWAEKYKIELEPINDHTYYILGQK